MGIYPDEVTTFAAVVLYGAPVAVAVLSYLLGCINGAIATSHIFYHTTCAAMAAATRG
mgnify:CR=1 FL=1